VSTQLVQIAKKTQLDRTVRFTSLAHLLTPEFLKETWKRINRRGVGGVHGESIEQFESPDLISHVMQVRYRALPSHLRARLAKRALKDIHVRLRYIGNRRYHDVPLPTYLEHRYRFRLHGLTQPVYGKGNVGLYGLVYLEIS
jgi:hypothetical protein